MANHDPYEIPDVTLSGSLVTSLMAAMEWAEYHADTLGESRAAHEIRHVSHALDYEAVRSWMRQEVGA